MRVVDGEVGRSGDGGQTQQVCHEEPGREEDNTVPASESSFTFNVPWVKVRLSGLVVTSGRR